MNKNNYLRIFFTGVGGQGILLATKVIGEAALMADIPVVMGEVHGMAQRGGVVEASVVLGDRWSPVIADGEADVMISFEPLETLRALSKCHRESIVITNTVPIPPFSVTQGAFAYPSLEEIFSAIKREVKEFYPVNALSLAEESGAKQSVNVVLVGFLAGLFSKRNFTLLPSADIMKKSLERIVPKNVLDVNIKAFELGYKGAINFS